MGASILIALLAAIALATWVYTKTMRSTGSNTNNSLIAAGVAGGIAFLAAMFLMSFLS